MLQKITKTSGCFDIMGRHHCWVYIKHFFSVRKCPCDFLEVFEIFCDPGSKPTVMLVSFALRYWQQFTEIPRLQCPWHTHPCRTRLRGNRWRVLWCCRIKALNPVPAISVAGVEFIVCDTELPADTYSAPYIDFSNCSKCEAQFFRALFHQAYRHIHISCEKNNELNEHNGKQKNSRKLPYSQNQNMLLHN